MHLKCSKCKKSLTEDLYFCSTKWARGLSLFFYEHKTMLQPGKVYDEHNKVKKGLFFIKPEENAFSNYFDEDEPAQLIPKRDKAIIVSEKSILPSVIPPFLPRVVNGITVSTGCCNHGMGRELKCDCGHVLGNMHLDCMESESIFFKLDSVDRVY